MLEKLLKMDGLSAEAISYRQSKRFFDLKDMLNIVLLKQQSLLWKAVGSIGPLRIVP